MFVKKMQTLSLSKTQSLKFAKYGTTPRHLTPRSRHPRHQDIFNSGATGTKVILTLSYVDYLWADLPWHKIWPVGWSPMGTGWKTLPIGPVQKSYPDRGGQSDR